MSKTQLASSRRLSAAWIVVVAITAIYLVIDGSADDGKGARGSAAATVTAVVLALAKLRVIIHEFMDVRHAPKVLRRAMDTLVIVMGACLLATYVVGRAVA